MMDGDRDEEGGLLPVEAMPGQEESQLLQAPEEEDAFALADKVFGNDLIREIIVNHAIRQGSSFLDTATICVLRTLGIDWNDSVCKLLHKNHLPLYRINVGNQSRLNDQHRVEGMAEMLDQLTETFACSSNILGRTPTFELILNREAFRRENYNCLYNFLIACGGGLVSINFYIPINGGSMNWIFPNLSLPSLHKAVLSLTDVTVEGEILESDNMTQLLQSVFNAAMGVKVLHIIQNHPYQSSVFECIVLPPTLTTLDVTLEVETQDLALLILRSPLPNLTSLILTILEDLVTEGSFSKILENVRFTLKKLSIYSELTGRENTVVFRLPIMEKLEIFEAYAERFLPEATRNSSLEACLPKLRKLRLCDHTNDMIRTWTAGSKFSLVEELHIETEYENLNFDTETMGSIHLAFPNVTKLELGFTDISNAALQYMFMEMANLVELKIKKGQYPRSHSATDWDSVLIGKPTHFTEALRGAPVLWPNVQLNNDEDPSIRKLTDLRSFSLRDGSLDEEFAIDVSLEFGFRQMPQLEKLEFSRIFSVTPEMADKWKVDGRILNFIS